MTTKTEKVQEIFEHQCRQCGDPVLLEKEQHEYYENNKATGVGFTIPKCWLCWNY